MPSYGDSGVAGRCADGAGWNLLGMTRHVYNFLKTRAQAGPDCDGGRPDCDGGLWAKAKGIVQHQYALTPLSWACLLHQCSIEGKAITPDDFAWLWCFPDVEHAPLSRLLGYGWFCGRRYDLNASTLDPRWESEGLMDIVQTQWDQGRQRAIHGPEQTKEAQQSIGMRILDVGTGSGCLLIELLCHYSSALGVGVDISAEAIDMAIKNAHRHGIGQRVRWMVGDGASVLMGGPLGGNDPLGSDPFDIIVSNPPYVPTGYVAPKNVALWDPNGALYAGVDGLDCYRAWIGPMVQRLAPWGILVLEIGYDQGGAVYYLCQQAGLNQIQVVPDHDGKDRYVWGRL